MTRTREPNSRLRSPWPGVSWKASAEQTNDEKFSAAVWFSSSELLTTSKGGGCPRTTGCGVRRAIRPCSWGRHRRRESRDRRSWAIGGMELSAPRSESPTSAPCRRCGSAAVVPAGRCGRCGAGTARRALRSGQRGLVSAVQCPPRGPARAVQPVRSGQYGPVSKVPSARSQPVPPRSVRSGPYGARSGPYGAIRAVQRARSSPCGPAGAVRSVRSGQYGPVSTVHQSGPSVRSGPAVRCLRVVQRGAVRRARFRRYGWDRCGSVPSCGPAGAVQPVVVGSVRFGALVRPSPA